jgi:hypothetical protein
MNSEFIIVLSIILPVGFLIWRQLTNSKRNMMNQCPRCGVDLEKVDTKIVKTINGSSAVPYDEHVMCLPCSKATKFGPKWLWLLAGATFIVVTVTTLLEKNAI